MANLDQLSEGDLTVALTEAEESLQRRKMMRGNSRLKSDGAWVEEAANRVYWLRLEVARRSPHLTPTP